MGADVPFIEYAEVNPKRNLRRGAQYPFLEMNAVPEGGGEPAYFTEREYDGGGGSRFAVGDTLFARITPCTENGKIAYVGDLNGSDAAFGSTELIVLSARVGKAEPRFIYQVAASERVRRRAVSRMLGTSGRQRVPTWFFTEELTVPAFTLPEQRAIAAVLDAIDDAIERTEAVIAATERLREALLHELLTRGVPGWHTEWKQVPGIGTVPACWEVVRLGDVCERPEYGAGAPARPYNRALPRYIRITDITDDGLLRSEDARSAEARLVARYELQDGDLLFARSGSVGRTFLYRKEHGPCVFAGYLIRFQARRERALPAFLAAWTRSSFYRRWVQTMLRAGAQPNINASEYASLPLPLPDLDEQSRISDAIEAPWTAQRRAREVLAALRAMKQTTADSLLSGRVRVSAPVRTPA